MAADQQHRTPDPGGASDPFKQTSEGFFDMFDVVIQLGAIIAVVVLFWNKIWPFYLKKNNYFLI